MFSRVTVGKEITAKKGEPDHMPKPHDVSVAGCIYGLPTPLSEKLDTNVVNPKKTTPLSEKIDTNVVNQKKHPEWRFIKVYYFV